MKKTFLFLAAAIFAVSNLFAEEVTVTKTIAEVQAYNNWETQYVDDKGFWHRTLNLDENIQLAALPESPESTTTQNGILYLNTTTSAPSDWRLYQARGGFQIITKEGCVLKSATFEFGNKNGGCLVYGGKNYTTGQTITFDDTKALEEIAVGSTTGKTNGQARITSFTVVYEKGGTPERVLESIYVDGTAEKLEYFVGEEFDPAGLKVMGKYDTGDDTEITAGIVWTIDPETLALGTTSVAVTAQYKDFTSEVFTVNNIVVKEKVVPTGYAGTYTSNVELTTEGGTSASAAKVIIGGTEYDAIKAGTGKVAGACVVTIPAATKTLHFHAAAWNGETVKLDINGTEYALVADAGVSNNTPFTLQNDPATQDYFTLDPKGATTITFTATSGKRFVIFGVNAELQEGVVTAPSFTPTDADFDQEVEVTLTADEGAEIYYTLDGTTPSNASTKYESAFKLTATTTVKAIAIKGGKSSDVANKTYTLIPAYTLAEIAAITPANQKFVLVLNNEAIVDIYTGKSGDVSGIYFQVGDKKIELYNQGYAFPKTWEVGGTVSGRVVGVWTDYNGQWELKIDAAEIEKLTYTEPSPTGINNVKANAKATKAIVNGQIVIIRDNKTYNVLGF